MIIRMHAASLKCYLRVVCCKNGRFFEQKGRTSESNERAVGYLELTLAFAGSHVCDCGVIWRLMVLGEERRRAGARGVGWAVMLGGRVCDGVVTPCDLRRLETEQLAILGLFLLLFLG